MHNMREKYCIVAEKILPLQPTRNPHEPNHDLTVSTTESEFPRNTGPVSKKHDVCLWQTQNLPQN